MSARVERTLGPRAGEEQLIVEARVTSEGDHFALQVRLGGSQQSEWSTLTAQSCEALAEATAVIAAALLPLPAPPPAPEEPPPEPADTPTPVPMFLEGKVGAGIEYGALPELSPSLTLGMAFSIARLRGAVSAAAFWPREATVEELPEARPQVGLYVVALSLCYDVAVGAAFLSPCAHMEGGQLFARERGLPSGGTGRAPWIAPGGSLAVRVPIRGPWSLSPEVLVFAPIRDNEFFVGPSDEAVLVHRSRTLSLRALLTLGVRFWSLEKLW